MVDETLRKLEDQIKKFGDPWLNETLDQYAEKIGHVAMSWSRMQEHLGQLFAYLVSPLHPMRGWAAWHAIASDLAQRAMLAAVVRETYEDPKDPMRVEIEWMLGRIAALLDNRNGAVHVAFQMGIGDTEVTMVPIDQTGNPRAKKLAGRELRDDFEFTHHRIAQVSLHAQALVPFLLPPPLPRAKGPLPQRPPSPTPPQTKANDPLNDQGSPQPHP